jgi:hypothetical protein
MVPAAAEMQRSLQPSTEFCRPVCALPPSPSKPLLVRHMPMPLSRELFCGGCSSGSWRKRVFLSHRSITKIVNELDRWPETAAFACTDAHVGDWAFLLGRPRCSLPCWSMRLQSHPDINSLAEWSKALAPGGNQQGRGFDAHSCHLFDWLWLLPGALAGAIALSGGGPSAYG